METVPCHVCGTPTVATGTRLCDPCWELSRRVTDATPAQRDWIIAQVDYLWRPTDRRPNRPDHEIVGEWAVRLIVSGDFSLRRDEDGVTRAIEAARALLAEARRQCAGEAQVEGGAQ